MRVVLFVILMSLSGIRTVQAAPYGMAGCGPGSVLVKDQGQWPQFGAGMINHPWPLGFWWMFPILWPISYMTPGIIPGSFATTHSGAITSGTSGCVTETEARAQVAFDFIQTNRKTLDREMARGEGERLEVYRNLTESEGEASWSDATVSF